jgi:hypothetical protein
MMGYFWLVTGLGLLGFLGYRAGRIWQDARQRRFPPSLRWKWALAGSLRPNFYWWRARIEALSPDEQAKLAAHETAALGLSRADSEHCPLCGTEVPRAWIVGPDGRSAVAHGPINCPRCDFRLDACRHCAHFTPGSAGSGGVSPWGLGGLHDLGSGRCSRYKSMVSVEQAYTADMARRLRERGYDQIRAPLPIIDSFLPPDFCTSFTAERKRLQDGGIRWPDARRLALLRLLPPAGPAVQAAAERPTAGR